MILDMLIVFASIPAIAFPFVYWATSTWYRSALGWALMVSSITVGMLFLLGTLNVFFGEDYPGRDVLRPILLTLCFSFMWIQTIAYVYTVRKLLKRQGGDDLVDERLNKSLKEKK